ncbi:hypothetical protein [Lysobacter silvisoli]|uniref:Uncharacterized protein n=1 Tax=Lysobacter silvisoli TaxID=2293254 RepID=A0A371K3J4_9GAMM|nr:hypothetical protein [Lysobacter silvisoli]RDZ28505.1 hypothetical protein DX914_05075 [Lysobacter silvisoli]
MGSANGGQSKTQELIVKVNNLSGAFDSDRADDATYKGMNRYLNGKDSQHMNWFPDTKDARVNRYRDITALAGDMGMSEQHRHEVLTQAYKSLNGHDALKDAGIAPPGQPARKDDAARASSSVPSQSAHEHPKDVRQDLDALLSNPRSFLSLSGHKAEDLLKLSTKDLGAAVDADKTFVRDAAPYWNLPGEQRQATASHVRDNFNAELSYRLKLTGVTNATPTHAFVAGKETVVSAVNQGYNIYSGPNHTEALKAIGQASISINLAVGQQMTLAGRGTDSLAEQTMSQNPDGHNTSKSVVHK